MKYDTGLFLFGSYMQSVNPHDIDLLWLYDKTVMSPESIRTAHLVMPLGFKTSLNTRMALGTPEWREL